MAKILELAALDFGSLIRPGERVMWGQSSAEPTPLVEALMAQRASIGNFGVFLGASYSGAVRPEHADCVRLAAYSGTGENRRLAQAGCLDIYPLHYSQLATQIASGALRIDVLLLQLAPADAAGRYSLSMAYEYLVPAIDRARLVIAEVNTEAPWTHGERSLAEDEIDYVVHTSRAPFELRPAVPAEAERRIARRIASLIEDGATLQYGIGALPEAVLGELNSHRNLGVHSGTIGDAVADLMECGAVTNARKSIDAGVTIGGVMFGSRRIQRFCHQNAAIQFRSSEYTHNSGVLARIDQLAAINAAIEVDLTGQINAEVAGNAYVGAVGGAMDFLRAAQTSKGGLPIVALQSTAGKPGAKLSRIVRRLSGPVSTPRADAGLIVTEHGVADLRGCSVSERARRLIAVADPEFREALEREAAGAG
jgi:acyl-CoA hydrolase